MPYSREKREFRAQLHSWSKIRKTEQGHKHFLGAMVSGPAVIVILLLLGVSFKFVYPNANYITSNSDGYLRGRRFPPPRLTEKNIHKLLASIFIHSGGVEIENKNSFDWSNVYVMVDPGPSRPLFTVEINKIKSKETRLFPFYIFKNENGDTLDSVGHGRHEFGIMAKTPQPLGYGKWTGKVSMKSPEKNHE